MNDVNSNYKNIDSNSYDIVSNSIEQTLQIGFTLGKLIQPGDVITLSGDLGAGKTTLTKGIAKGLGINTSVSSPTFTIIKEYTEGNLPLYHFDLYRLGENAIDEDLGYDDYIYGNGVCVIEWSQYIEELLPTNRLNIVVTHKDNELEQVRTLNFSYIDKKWDRVVHKLNE
jgi:tRNA threonylcarbamoyladenosine biosynthesis protein TsaE